MSVGRGHESRSIIASATVTARFCNLPADKREHITTAATTEFARHGYEQANTNRIAKEADISVGVLFKYFPTKADLFLYVASKGGEDHRGEDYPRFWNRMRGAGDRRKAGGCHRRDERK